MESISSLVKTTIPNYMSNLPIPNTFLGWFKLSFKDWMSLVPPTAIMAGLGYTFYWAYCPEANKKRCGGKSRCNGKIRLNEPKVVDMIDIENMGDKEAFCRCWKSKKWPHCDGSHGEHNKLTGDNLGPVVIKKKDS